MKISAINNNISRSTIRQNQKQAKVNYFVNNNQIQNNNISFGATFKNTLLKMEANGHLKESQKIASQAKKIVNEADKYQIKARKLQNEAANALADSLPLIRVAKTMGGKYLFNELPQGIKCICCEPVNNGYHIYVKRDDNTARHIFSRNNQIYIYESDADKNVKQMCVFDEETQELTTCAQNYRTEAGYSLIDKKYTFINGQIKTIDEQFVVKNDGTFEKSLTRYEFEDGELIECVSNLENYDGIKGTLGQVFSFSSNLVYHYCEDVVKRLDDDKTSAKKSMIFYPDGSLSTYISKQDDVDNFLKNSAKIFQYEDSKPKTAMLHDKSDLKVIKF